MTDIILVANVHMHTRTANKETKNAHAATKVFLDVLASYLLRHRVRVLAGDFNMSFLSVIVELRARGFQNNLTA